MVGGPADDEATTTPSSLNAFERDVLLTTGRAVHVRATRAPDVEPLRTFYGQPYVIPVNYTVVTGAIVLRTERRPVMSSGSAPTVSPDGCCDKVTPPPDEHGYL